MVKLKFSFWEQKCCQLFISTFTTREQKPPRTPESSQNYLAIKVLVDLEHMFVVNFSVSWLSVRMTVATATYTVVGETLRFVIPTHMHCSIGCGGRDCKYEDASRWSEDQQAIRGIYSSWYLK